MRKTLRYRDDGIEVTVTFTSTDPATRLASLQSASERMQTWRRLAVRWARDERHLTFQAIGDALGISKVAAIKLHRQSGRSGERLLELPVRGR